MNIDTELFTRGLTIRLFEEKLLELFSQGRLHGTVHTCIGQELVALAVCDQLSADDWVFSNHRCHGHYLARTGDIRGLLAEIMGHPSGICAGRGGSQHICEGHFFSNGVQGGGVPIAAGVAMAASLDAGDAPPAVGVAFIGDGTLGQGVLYETLNLASLWSVPLLIVLEHNGYAQSTDTTTTIAGDISKRFSAFDVAAFSGDIWDQAGLFTAAHDAVRHARDTRGPAVLIAGCYRLKAHSKGDDNRSPESVAAALARDPLERYAKECPTEAASIRERLSAAIDAALLDIERDTTVALPAETVEMASPEAHPWHPVRDAAAAPARVVERLRKGLGDLLEEDPAVMLLGEDLEDEYGGAFKVTRGLSSRFPGRVRNTPISEAAVVGFGNGLAIGGRRPIVEIMFGDFIALAADQIINQATKFSYIYNGKVAVPVIIRTPMGGRRGYGATHSQTLEKHFMGTPGLVMVAVNDIMDPSVLLGQIHRHVRGPCLIIENKTMYSSIVQATSPLGIRWEEDGAPLPTLRLVMGKNPSLTIVAYGGMARMAEKAAADLFFEDEIDSDIIVPTCIEPLNMVPIVESVSRTGRLLVVEEGQGFAGFGSEVVAGCSERLGGRRLMSARVCAARHPIPSARDQEQHSLPQSSDILAAMRRLVSQP